MNRLIIASLAFAFSLAVSAVPAKRGVYKLIKLSDGTEIKAELCGDEFLNYWQAADGRRFVKDNAANCYVTADLSAMAELATAKRALRIQDSPANSPARVTAGADHQPYEGEKRGLVILVQFSDLSFKDGHDVTLYNRILNEENFTSDLGFVGSVHDYFSDQSNGVFNLSFDIAGPVTLPNGYAYYGGDDENARNPNAKNIGEFVQSAIEAVDGDIDFSKYDWDNDGEVDQVFFLYAGRGQASGGGDDTIWPHEWKLTGALGNTLTCDGVTINTYACGCEMFSDTQIEGVGTFCHEFSHCLGIPDMYDTYDSTNGNYGMMTWDVMDQGSYNGNTFIPAGYTGWERMYAGWKEPVELTEATSVNDMKALENGGDIYIVRNDANSDEYYLLENRQLVGWDAGLDGKGLLIVHVDFVSARWENNYVNNSTRNHPCCQPIAADNSYSKYTVSGDTYPYGSVNSLTNETTPAATVFTKNTDGSYYMNKPITGITQNADGTVSFEISILDTSQLFYESFDNCNGKGGNDGIFNKIGANKNVGQGTFSPDNEGWTADTSGGANACAMFTGTASTPEIEVGGNAILSFTAGYLSSSSGTLTVTAVSTDGITLGTTEYALTSGKMTEFSTDITGTGKMKLSFSTGGTFFLDEVEVKNNTYTDDIQPIAISDSAPSQQKAYSGRIYSVEGRYVGTDINALKSGLYIRDGKKIVRK